MQGLGVIEQPNITRQWTKTHTYTPVQALNAELRQLLPGPVPGQPPRHAPPPHQALVRTPASSQGEDAAPGRRRNDVTDIDTDSVWSEAQSHDRTELEAGGLSEAAERSGRAAADEGVRERLAAAEAALAELRRLVETMQ